jgi:hypothetical protein
LRTWVVFAETEPAEQKYPCRRSVRQSAMKQGMRCAKSRRTHNRPQCMVRSSSGRTGQQIPKILPNRAYCRGREERDKESERASEGGWVEGSMSTATACNEHSKRRHCDQHALDVCCTQTGAVVASRAEELCVVLHARGKASLRHGTVVGTRTQDPTHGNRSIWGRAVETCARMHVTPYSREYKKKTRCCAAEQPT